jgi:hypothetical protein
LVECGLYLLLTIATQAFKKETPILKLELGFLF